MSVEQPKSKLGLSEKMINLEEYQYLNSIMDVRRSKMSADHHVQVKKKEGSIYSSRRPLSQGQNGKKILRYFTLESMVLLVGLTASLLILPLVLPPLPPPPLMLLMLPICILGLLMLLAFMPSNVRDITHTYV